MGPYETMKTCPGCGETKSLDDFHIHRGKKDGRQARCRTCTAQANKAWHADGRYRAAHLRRVYGITAEQYDEMLADQGGVCAICGESCSTGRRLAVDHDHDTGAVRGLLCHRCNRGIGWLRDSPARLRQAADYLEGSRAAHPRA